ncbi:hypothetical protein Tco_0902842 [Tanacetum coccineum]
MHHENLHVHCRSTAFIQDPPVIWDFVTECGKIHLEKSKGVVGRALSSKDLWYCRDVTKLNEDEYPPPLAICACTCELTGQHEDDRLTIKDVVQTLKGVMVEASAGLELGDTSSIQEV